MTCLRLFLGCLLSFAVLASDARALDRVTLKDGKTVDGRVVFEGPDRIVVRVGTKDRDIAIADVVEIHSRARDDRDVVQRWEKLAPEDTKGRLELAQFAREHDLEGEARLLALSVLSKDAICEAAHVFLGNEKKLGAWLIKVGSHSIPFDRWMDARLDFSDADPMPTAHFMLRTNVPLDAACNFALELELFYLAFMDWFRPELDLYEVLEPIAVHVHADNKSYPGGTGRKGYFDPQANTVFVDVSGGLTLDVLIHESTHALLNATAARAKDARGSIPSWIDEGLADYMSLSRGGVFGHPLYASSGSNRRYFAMHAEAKKPLELSRVLALSPTDYTLSPIMGLAYAQSFTLVHFCLNGGDGAYHAKFFDFMRSCYKGKSSSTDFKAAMKIDVKAFEAEWLDWAKKHR